MKLYIMKQETLNSLKGNLHMLYPKYYTESNTKWITDIYGEDAFIEFKEIPDFSLTDLNSELGKGEIDLNNCKIVYEKLMFLSESQASDERLWAGLAHTTFYDYMRRRWGYGYGKKPKDSKKEAGELRTRFFYSGGTRAGFYRNTLAKCWWVGRNTYDASSSKPFEKLDIIGSNDINSKITEFFFNFTFSSNPFVLEGIIDAIMYFREKDVVLSVREHIRPAMSYLNAVGGAVILDCLPKGEITNILVNAILRIMKGDEFAISIDNIENDESEYEDDDASEANESIVSVSKEDVVQDENDSGMEIVLGCKVLLKDIDGNMRTFKVDYINGVIPEMVKPLAGHHIGDSIIIQNCKYSIENVYL